MGAKSLNRRLRASTEVLWTQDENNNPAKPVGRNFFEIKVYFLAFLATSGIIGI
jgi:hypothetical protein